ncbi:MAG: hypothetical protein J0L99_11305 [Chitinophagales bacterium]|nr:hypothetical protein [Chitinophagales bacterium]
MKMLRNFSLLLSLLSLTLLWSACIKTEFDEPPVGGVVVELTPNKTIKALKALHLTPGGFDRITDDIIIGGEVVMDDRSGNYYKTIVIQDETGGIEVKFNDASLYGSYPVGRKIYIRCQDLLLTDYNGLTQLIGSTVEQGGVLEDVGITEAQARLKVVGGAYSTSPVAPKVVNITSINADMISTYIRLEDVQFITADTGKTWADPVTQFSLNRTIEDCDKRQLVIRTSGFADFAGQKTPGKNGAIEGVLGVFGSTYQLFIRNADAAAGMTADRCASTGQGTVVDISSIRAGFSGTTTVVPSGKKIRGIVISDRAGNNLNNRNIYLQDGTAGIVVRFSAAHSYNLGDEIEVNVSGQELSEFNGLMQVNNVPLANSLGLAAGKSVTPRVVTVAQLNANFNAWESTLVQIENASITGGTTLSGSRTVNDGSGSITMFTQTTATFSGNPVPANAVKVTAIVSDFNGKQIILRNASDIQ